MNKTLITTVLAASISLSGCVSAGPKWDEPRWERHKHSHQDRARVIKVRPIYETVRVPVPHKRCVDWDPKDHPREFSHHHDSHTKPLVGALIGGVIGNQFGEGNGKTAMTVAGTLIGASVAHDLDHKSHRKPHHRRYQNCDTVTRYEERREVVGYRVKYRYNGQVYRARMDNHPGDYVRVRVRVTLLDS